MNGMVIMNPSEIINSYKNGTSIRTLALQNKVSFRKIRKIISNSNIKIRMYKPRTYTLDEHFFEKINTKEKAYFLGLLYADGWVSKNYVGISLKKEDSYILNKLIKCLKYNNSLKYYKKEYPRVDIHSKFMSNNLIEKGMVQNKSKILRFPNCIPKSLLRYFILGVFDGDGNIYFKQTKRRLVKKFSIVGSEHLLYYIRYFLKKENINFIYLRNHKNIYEIRASRKDTILKLFNYLYKDSDLFLKRKKIIFSNLVTLLCEK